MRSETKSSGAAHRYVEADDGLGFEAERMSALNIAILHFFVVFAAPTLLWKSDVVGQRSLVIWTAAEAALGVFSLAGYWSISRERVGRFVRFARLETAGTAATFGALPWLGSTVATSTPSKHVLLVALLAVTSVSAANSAQIPTRRPFFNLLIVIVALSYAVAFSLGREWVFAFLSLLWCVSIATMTRVGYTAMVELLDLRKESDNSARHDDLTGLLSRSAFFETLHQRSLRSTSELDDRPTLVLFDLDGFKATNDSFGHAAGDAVLRAVADRLELFLPPDAAIGRLGGDEFAAVFRLEATEMRAAVDSTLSALSEPIRIDGRELYIAASAGWTLVEQGASSPDLMAQADAAMYQSKNSETDASTGFDSNLRNQLDRSLVLRQRFRSALKRHEIEFWAQPLVRTSDATPVAVELLARWPQGDTSVVGPLEFTRVADETGLAVELDRQALVAARTLLAQWEGDPVLGAITVKANISPVHLHNGDLGTSIRELIPVPMRDRLGLEFVESRLIGAAERNHEQMRDLMDMGIVLSIDDFGVGYSSLTYLRSLPVSEIKIDRSFVTNVDSDKINQGLIRAIVDIASTLGLPTVAEGVETEAEFAAIARLGVGLAQGYLLGRPVPVDDVAAVVGSLSQSAASFSETPSR